MASGQNDPRPRRSTLDATILSSGSRSFFLFSFLLLSFSFFFFLGGFGRKFRWKIRTVTPSGVRTNAITSSPLSCLPSSLISLPLPFPQYLFPSIFPPSSLPSSPLPHCFFLSLPIPSSSPSFPSLI